MGDLNDENNVKKRIRQDWEKPVDLEGLEVSSPESKRVRTASNLNSPEAETDDSVESAFNSSEANRIPVFPDDILDILDEPDTVSEQEPPIQDLDCVIKSFEEEISHSLSLTQQSAAVPVNSSECSESQPDLGYLLEASDDELGLPPTTSPSDDSTKSEAFDFITVTPEAVGLNEILGFEDEMSSYDLFGFGIAEENQSNSSEFETVGGLFDYGVASDYSEFLWRPESESLHPFL